LHKFCLCCDASTYDARAMAPKRTGFHLGVVAKNAFDASDAVGGDG
jgi:hypothetical protein